MEGTMFKISGLLAKLIFRVVFGMSSVSIVLHATMLGMFDILS